MLTLYPSSRPSKLYFFFYICYYINKKNFFKNDPCKSMGKNMQIYAITQVHFPREREGSLTANNPSLSATNVIQLNRTHSSKFTTNFAFPFCTLAIHPKYPAPFINTLCFRYLPRLEILSNSRELCKFRAVRPHSP